MGSVDTTTPCQFGTRVSRIPVVHTLLNYATSTYERTKGYNPIITYALDNVEKSAAFANEKAKPIVRRFGKHIALADGLACKGLEKLEEKVLVISKITETVVDEASSLYTGAIHSGATRYHDVKTYGSNKIDFVKNQGLETITDFLQSPCGKTVVASVTRTLSLTEVYVDKLLPPVNDEEADEKKTDVLERFSRLASRIPRRVYGHAVDNAYIAKTAATNSVQRYLNHQLITNAYGSLEHAWEQINEELSNTDNAGSQSLIKRLWFSTHLANQQLESGLTTARSTILEIPATIGSRVAMMYDLSSSLFVSFHSKILVVHGLSARVTAYVRDVNPRDAVAALHPMKIRFVLEERNRFSLQAIVHISAVKWLVSDSELLQTVFASRMVMTTVVSFKVQYVVKATNDEYTLPEPDAA